MSTNTPPTSSLSRIERHDPAAYRARLDGLVGDRDPLDVLAATPDALGKLVQVTPAETLRRRPYADRWTWTPLEVIGHLHDAEWTFGWRIRTILCDHEPTITAMDQEKWAATLRHNEREPAELSEHFAALRRINLAQWRRIEPGQMRRVGRHAERGEESLAVLLRLHAGHDLTHLEQIERYLAVLSDSS